MNYDLRPAEILLVEDNIGDVRLIEEALKDTKLLNNLHNVFYVNKMVSKMFLLPTLLSLTSICQEKTVSKYCKK